MVSALNILTDEEVRHGMPDEEDRCFGSLRTERGHLPLKAMDIQCSINGLVSHVTLQQKFVNTITVGHGDEARNERSEHAPIEATYLFPLPSRAAVTSFKMVINDRVIHGIIKERGQARQDYSQAIAAGHRAAITEEERPGVFTIRVGNIMPNEEATVCLTMTGPLPFDEGEATFRFPLVVAPRYIPGNPLGGENVGDGVSWDTDAVPDASRISPPVLLPGYPNPVNLSLSVDLSGGGLPISDVRSSLHAVTHSEGDQQRIELQPGERLNRDFILRFRLSEDAMQTALMLKSDEEGGTFLLTVVPPATLSRAEKPRDVIFILDRSGSMGGWKMVAARRAVARMVDTLQEKDRFNLYAFDNTIETPDFGGTNLVMATDRNRFRAVEFLAKLEARGGTEMARPLDQAAQQLSGGYDERDRIMVLVTDGQVGNEDQILRNLEPRIKNTRIFTLGIDRAVNEGFLKRLATLGGGLSELVESEDRLDEVMDKVHRRIGTPLLTEVSIVPTGLEILPDTIVPRRLPDLFTGAPITIMGRYRGSSGEILLKGTDAVGSAYEQRIRGYATDNRAITSLWARGHVRDLEDLFVIGTGNKTELEKRILKTSLDFSVLCRFTAFVAVDASEVVNPGGELHKVMQPADAPEGWDMFGSSGAAGGGAKTPARRSRRMPRPSRAAPPPPSAPAPGQPPAPMQRMISDEPCEQCEPADDLMRSEGRFRATKKQLKDSREKAVNAVRGAIGKRVSPAKPTPKKKEAADTFEVYRQRAHALLKLLGQDESYAGRITTLSSVAAHLRALVEDLESVDAPRELVSPLAALLGELTQLSSGKLSDTDLSALFERTKTTLQRFAGAGEQQASTSSRGAFWK